MKKVIVVGLGYGGIAVLKKLANHPEFTVTAIDKNPFHFLQPEVYSFIANRSYLSEIIIDLFSLTKGLGKNITFLNDKVISVDFDSKKVICESCELSYDYLVLSVGSRTFFPQIEGLKKYASGVKTIEKSLEFKQKFEKEIFNRIKAEGICPVDKYKRFNIVVGGAGLAGVEIAAEMASYSQDFYKKAGFICEGVTITLIEALPSILNGMDSFLIETAYKRLNSLGIKIITGKKIIKVEKNYVHLEDGTKEYMDFLIWTGGIVGSSLLEKLNIKTNKKRQAIVNEFFQLENIDDVYAIGDCAQIVDINTGKTIPPTAQLAIETGKILGENLIRKVEGLKMIKKNPSIKGIISALGGKYGAGYIKLNMSKKIKFKGLPAYILKEIVFKSYKYPLKKVAKKGLKGINY